MNLKLSKKTLAIIAIILAISGYFLIEKINNPVEEITKTSESFSGKPWQNEKIKAEIVDWKTYKNKEYGFEIKYPTEYQFETNNNTLADNAVFDSYFINSNGYDFQISKVKHNDINEWYQDWRGNFLEGEVDCEPCNMGDAKNQRIIYSRDVKIGVNSVKEVRVEGSPYIDTNFYFIKDSYLYSFYYRGLGGRVRLINEKYKEPYYWEQFEYKKEIDQLRDVDLFLFKKIISTFRFVEKNSETGSFSVVYPNGGEILNVGEKYTIKLSYLGLDYSDNHKTVLWLKKRDKEGYVSNVGSSPISAMLINKSLYSWIVPNTVFSAGAGGDFRLESGDNYFIEAQVYMGPEIDFNCWLDWEKKCLLAERIVASDASDNTFTIKNSFVKPIITIISPDGGEKWQKGKKYNISWQASSFVKTINIFLTSPDSSYLITDDSPNNGIYEWTIPAEIPLDDYYKIDIVSESGYIEDRGGSNTVFSIVQ